MRLGELVKYAALDGGIFELLKANADKLSEREFLFSLILPSVKHKAKVVEEDEKETGERKSLNVGHTTGHALELASGLSHGESVLWGMLLETKLAMKYGVCAREYGEELTALVHRALDVPPSAKSIFRASVRTRKRRGRIRRTRRAAGSACRSRPQRENGRCFPAV